MYIHVLQSLSLPIYTYIHIFLDHSASRRAAAAGRSLGRRAAIARPSARILAVDWWPQALRAVLRARVCRSKEKQDK